MRRICSFLLAGSFVAVSAWAESPDPNHQWPRWRGPLDSGVAPHADPPLVWSTDHNVRFKVKVKGNGNSSPIVWGDTIFVTTAIPEGAVDTEPPEGHEELSEWRRENSLFSKQDMKFTLLALDRKTGALKWHGSERTSRPHEGTHRDGSWAAASPITDGEHVCAHFGSNGTACYTMDGKLAWHKDLGDMETRNAFGEGASPALHGNTLVINWDHEGPSFIVALDKRTGEELWRAKREEEPTSWSTPIVVEQDGKELVIVSATDRIRAYDLANGKEIWEAGGMTLNTIPSPIEHEGMILAASGFRGNAVMAIKLAGAKGDLTGSEAIAWSLDRDTPYVPSILVSGDELYMLKGNKGILSSLDAATGKVHYTERLKDVPNVYASPVAAAGRVYIVGREGTTVVLKEGPELELLAINEIRDGFDSSPAVVGDAIFLRGREYLWALALDGP